MQEVLDKNKNKNKNKNKKPFVIKVSTAKDNTKDELKNEVNALKTAGFHDVQCYEKIVKLNVNRKNFVKDKEYNVGVIKQEYVEGETLSNYVGIFSNGLSSLQKAQIAFQLSDIVFLQHQLRHNVKNDVRNAMVHRDIKPDNIMVDIDKKTGKVSARLIDYGLTWIDKGIHLKNDLKNEFNQTTQTSSSAGTKFYIAPEQENYNITFKSDIFSLGKTLQKLFYKENEKVDKFLKRMVNDSIEKRPSSFETLGFFTDLQIYELNTNKNKPPMEIQKRTVIESDKKPKSQFDLLFKKPPSSPKPKPNVQECTVKNSNKKDSKGFLSKMCNSIFSNNTDNTKDTNNIKPPSNR